MDIQAQVGALAECMNIGADRMDGRFDFPLPVYFGRTIVVAETPQALKAILHRSRAVLRVNGFRKFRLEVASMDRQADSRFRVHVDWHCEGRLGQLALFRTVLYCRGLPTKGAVEVVQVDGLRQSLKASFQRLN